MNYSELVDYINKNFKKVYFPVDDDTSVEFINCSPETWRSFAEFLNRDESLKFDSLMCLTGIDYGTEEETLAVIYNLFSMTHHHKIEVRVTVSKSSPTISSVEDIWRVADWFEREVFDMYGIKFDGHRDLRRILLPDDWEGYPLRKDYRFPETYHGILVDKVKEGWE